MTSFSIGQIGSGLLALIPRGKEGSKNYETQFPAFRNRFPRSLRGISALELEAEKRYSGPEAGYTAAPHWLECR